MKLNFKASKIANQYFYINNLTEWHFSCDPEINEAWLRMTGPLTTEEKIALSEITEKIFKKYYFELWDIFYGLPDKKAWPALKRKINKKDYELIRDTFKVFDKKFSLIWNKLQTLGKKNVKLLSAFARKSESRKFMDELGFVFGGKAYKNSIVLTCVILFSPLKAGMGGGANMKSPTVVFELPSKILARNELARAISVIGHETGHFLFKKRGGEKIIKGVIKELNLPEKLNFLPLSTYELINESITASFAPKGYLAKKYFPLELQQRINDAFENGKRAVTNFYKNKKVKFYNELDGYFTRQLWPYAIQYLNENQALDKNYVLEAAKLVDDLIKNKKERTKSSAPESAQGFRAREGGPRDNRRCVCGLHSTDKDRHVCPMPSKRQRDSHHYTGANIYPACGIDTSENSM